VKLTIQKTLLTTLDKNKCAKKEKNKNFRGIFNLKKKLENQFQLISIILKSCTNVMLG
jgi:hypothetical protein